MRALVLVASGVVVLAGLAGATPVAAETINGSLWHVPEAVAQNAIPGNVPGRTPDVTFVAPDPLNFSATNATVGTWLASGGASSIVVNTPGTLGTLMDNFTIGTLLDFTGMVTVAHGDMFTVAHDDGLTLTIGGLTVVNAPGPTSPTVTTATYTGPSGTLPFELTYSECCSGPAVLDVNLPFESTAGAPGPTFGSGLPGLVLAGMTMLGLGWRRRRNAV